MNFKQIAAIVEGYTKEYVTPFGWGLIVHAILPLEVSNTVAALVHGFGFNVKVGVNETQTKFFLTPIDN